MDAVSNNYAIMVKPEYEIANNNNINYSSCNNAVAGDRKNETINMRQQVIHQESHIPPNLETEELQITILIQELQMEVKMAITDSGEEEEGSIVPMKHKIGNAHRHHLQVY